MNDGMTHWSIPPLHQRPSLWGWERDPWWLLRPGEYWHRCDVKWRCWSCGEGVGLLAENKDAMFFQFPDLAWRAAVHKTLWSRGIHCLRYRGGVLCIAVRYVAGCDECDFGALYAEETERRLDGSHDSGNGAVLEEDS